MRTLPIDTSPLAPRDRPLATVVAEVAVVVAVLGFLTALVHAPLIATLLFGGVVGALLATVVPRFRLPETSVPSTRATATGRCCPAD